MTVRIVRWGKLVETPWKNGGGVAVDIAMSPGPAPGDGSDWRINVATIARSGPFSDYPGIDRDFWVLDGGPVELSVDGRPARLLHAGGAEYRFPGDVATHARLIGAPCRAFNVLTRRGGFTADVRSVEIGQRSVVPVPGSLLVGFAVAGAVDVAWGAGDAALGRFDTFVASGTVSVASERGAQAILVDLLPVDG